MWWRTDRIKSTTRWAGFLVLAATAFLSVVRSQEEVHAGLEGQFTRTVRPFLETYCISCHGRQQPAAQMDLSGFTTMAALMQDGRRWSQMLQRLEAEEMPPKGARHPMPQERRVVVDWFHGVRDYERRRNAGDPGVVLARRLSNAEYNYTIRDLTGVDIRPAREFPVDPANTAGFDNSGETFVMSPTLLKKYLAAAREVASHVVLKETVSHFAPHPIAHRHRPRQVCVNRIIHFYHATADRLGRLFLRHLAIQKPCSTRQARRGGRPRRLRQGESEISRMVWLTLDSPDDVGPIAKLQEMWRALPEPQRSRRRAGRGKKILPRNARLGARPPRKAPAQVGQSSAQGIGAVRSHLSFGKTTQFATHRRAYSHAVLQIEGDANSGLQIPIAKAEQPEFPNGNEDQPVNKKPARDPDLAIPADPNDRARYESAFERFASTFPDAFYISERGRIFLDRPKEKQDKGRLLSAGFHSMMGYFRDDIPLCELILDDEAAGDFGQDVAGDGFRRFH